MIELLWSLIFPMGLLATLGLPVLRRIRNERQQRSRAYSMNASNEAEVSMALASTLINIDREAPTELSDVPGLWGSTISTHKVNELPAATKQSLVRINLTSKGKQSTTRALGRLFQDGREGLRLAILSQVVLGPPKALAREDGFTPW